MIESTIPSQSPRQGPSQILSQGPSLDKAPRLSISIVIWILSSDTDTICQLNQFNTNSEAAMLSIFTWWSCGLQEGDRVHGKWLPCTNWPPEKQKCRMTEVWPLSRPAQFGEGTVLPRRGWAFPSWRPRCPPRLPQPVCRQCLKRSGHQFSTSPVSHLLQEVWQEQTVWPTRVPWNPG